MKFPENYFRHSGSRQGALCALRPRLCARPPWPSPSKQVLRLGRAWPEGGLSPGGSPARCT